MVEENMHALRERADSFDLPLLYDIVCQPSGPEAEENVEAEAIIKMQSAFRGHHVRFQQTEEARLQWLQFHLQTGEYEEARALCVSEKETQIVAAAEQGRWERGLELLDEMGAA